MEKLNKLRELNLFRFDPVAFLLIEKLKLSPISFGLWSFIITSLISLFTAWISNTLWLPKDSVGLLNDPFPWVGTLFASIIWGYYLWSYYSIIELLDKLGISDIIKTNPQEISKIIRRIYCNDNRKYSALFISIFFSISGFLTQTGNENSWYGSKLLPNVVSTAIILLGIYICSMLVFNLISNIWIFHQVLRNNNVKNNVKINPLHPDRCGGLRPLSDYSLNTTYLIAFFGVLVGVIILSTISNNQSNWHVYLLIPLYMILSVTCFFGPLWTAHSSMKNSKEELLNKIAEQFQTDYSNTHLTLDDDAEKLARKIKKIEQLEQFYNMTDAFPVWPFDVRNFRRYLLTLPSPVIPLLIPILQEIIDPLLDKII